MRKLTWAVSVAALAASLVAGHATAGPGPNGFTSENVEHVTYVPFEIGTATGANFFNRDGKRYMIVTGWKTFSIYEVTKPEAPALISTTPFGFQFENEEVATNGRIFLFSEQLPRDVLHIFDMESLTSPHEIAALPGAGDHTQSCIFNCRYAYGSEGTIVDLTFPDKPKIVGDWGETPGFPAKSGHDVEEVAPGLVLTDTQPIMLIDARQSVTRPKLLATGESEDGRFIHSIKWPRNGTDRFFGAAGETNADTRCNEGSAKFMIWDTKNWQKTKKFTMSDQFQYTNGTYVDGKPAVNGLGCSSHWFDHHSSWKDGGLVAVGSYEHGVRFILVNGLGKMREVGWFVPLGGSTSAAKWLSKDIVYSIDYSRGIDVLRYKGPLRS